MALRDFAAVKYLNILVYPVAYRDKRSLIALIQGLCFRWRDHYNHHGHEGYRTMKREASAMTVRQNLGELLNHVQYRGDSVVVTKDGKPVAALVDFPLYERIRRLRDSFDRLTDRLGRVYEEVPDEHAQQEIDEAVEQVRKARRRRR
jgi:prevent-host-death family protein